MPNSSVRDEFGGKSGLRAWSAFACIAIFIVAFALRWPSCGDSFWLDELHTAWAVDGAWSDVGARAGIGNQQPIYFYLLWVWRQLLPVFAVDFYGIEASLRLTSVVMTSLSAGLLCWLVFRRSGSLIAGVVAGLMIGIESSAIFFGTELRPYAAIVLLSTCAMGLAMIPRDRVGSGDRFLLHAVVILAALTQVTSLVTLGWLLAWVIASDWISGRGTADRVRTFVSRHWMVGLWIAGSAAWFFQHSSLWQSRSSWQSFANAESLVQLWELWPWMPVILVPAVIWGVSRMRRGYPVCSKGESSIAMLGFVLLISAISCFCLSYFGGVPLWHRRYLISGLPFLCGLSGILLGCVRTSDRQTWRELMVGLMGAAYLLLLVSQQGTLNRLIHGQFQLTHRGEDWRRATRFLAKHKSSNEVVWVDAGLIEQSRYPTFVEEPGREAYFRYPVNGPYRMEAAVGLGRDGLTAWLAQEDVKYLIRRGSGSRVNAKLVGIDVHGFGGVMVMIRKPLN
ncbi:hypothetical protein [Neorhodopirellula lusitana]|uniref:hypothetical protein n=1 Tax=Neorhodopirellula lusitana TaxID=445327 RepID=UPI00384C8F81